MGDVPPGSQPAGNLSGSAQDSRGNAPQQSNPGQFPSDNDQTKRQHGSFPSNSVQSGYRQTRQHPMQQHLQQAGSDSFNMSNFVNALPDMSYQNFNQPVSDRYSSGPPPPHGYQIQNMSQFAGPPLSPVASSAQYMPYTTQYQGGIPVYPAGHGSQHVQAAHVGQFYHSQGLLNQPQQQHNSPYYLQPGQYGPQGQIYPSGASPAHGGFSGDTRMSHPQRSSDQIALGISATPGRASSIASSTGQPSVVRGPPRKPRQSGHAIWIGNLPPQTDLMSLVFHVCKETSGLESLFLISKSNCAFANYQDEAACAAAQLKIHDSRFQSVRLVSRLRRTSAVTTTGVAIPTGPAALTPPSAPTAASTPSTGSDTKDRDAAGDAEGTLGGDDALLPKDKFFVVKSLTVEDLELSVRNGIWATQAHNEEALNKAYETADNVYLIFSANKSGEYFGYARMISPINDDPAAAIEFAPKAQAVDDPDVPKAIPTPATDFAPKGRIIDDSARGTIFWEADRDDGEGEDEEETRSNRSDQDDSPSPPKAWGKPFKIEWISTTRLPFYRTRGLRNPWNSNREVKIARDGTELETAVGRRLLGLFHRLPSPSVPSSVQIPNLSQQFQGGYGQMRAPFP